MTRAVASALLVAWVLGATPALARDPEPDQDVAVEAPEHVVSPLLQCIAWVESRGNPNATNRSSGAAGLYQFLLSTWETTPQGKAGYSRYDPVAATAAAEWMIEQGRVREWVAVSRGYC